MKVGAHIVHEGETFAPYAFLARLRAQPMKKARMAHPTNQPIFRQTKAWKCADRSLKKNRAIQVRSRKAWPSSDCRMDLL